MHQILPNYYLRNRVYLGVAGIRNDLLIEEWELPEKFQNKFEDDLSLHTEDIEVDKKIKRDKDLRNSKIVNPEVLKEELDRQDEIFNSPKYEKDFREMYSDDKLNIKVNGETKNCR
jgi:hypothetical protein